MDERVARGGSPATAPEAEASGPPLFLGCQGVKRGGGRGSEARISRKLRGSGGCAPPSRVWGGSPKRVSAQSRIRTFAITMPWRGRAGILPRSISRSCGGTSSGAWSEGVTAMPVLSLLLLTKEERGRCA